MKISNWKTMKTHLGKWKYLVAVGLIVTSFGTDPVAADTSDSTTLTLATMWESNPLSMKSRRSRFFNESEVLDTLVKLDYNLQMVPGLALSWERTSDTQWRFTLREGVTFHDGTDFNAQSAIDSLTKVMELLPYAPGMLDIAEMKAESPYILTIRTNKPFGALANQMTDAITGVYGAASFDAEGKYVKPIGTGPFKFTSYTKQDRTIVERFDDYWGKAPTLEKVVYRFIPDHAARTLAMEAGEVDLPVNILPADVKRLQADDNYITYQEPASGLYYMVLNTAKSSPFSDVRVRTAVNLMVNRDDLVTYGLDGVGIPAWEFFSPKFDLVAGDDPKYSLDMDRAATLMQEAGYIKSDGFWAKDGKPLTLRMISYSSRAEMPVITETVANMLMQAGIKTEIKMYTWPGMRDLTKKGEYDAYTVFWTPEMTGHPDTHLKAHFSSNSNMTQSGYGNAELDDLLVAARGLDAGAERDAAYQKILQIIHQDAPIMPLVHKVYVAASHKGVKNFRVHPSGFFFNFKEVWKE